MRELYLPLSTLNIVVNDFHDRLPNKKKDFHDRLRGAI